MTSLCPGRGCAADPLLGCWAAQPPVSHTITGLDNRHTDNHSVPRQPSRCSLSVQYSINDMRHSTLYYEIGFVLDDSAQLQASVSVLSTVKVGEVQAVMSVAQVY